MNQKLTQWLIGLELERACSQEDLRGITPPSPIAKLFAPLQGKFSNVTGGGKEANFVSFYLSKFGFPRPKKKICSGYDHELE